MLKAFPLMQSSLSAAFSPYHYLQSTALSLIFPVEWFCLLNALTWRSDWLHLLPKHTLRARRSINWYKVKLSVYRMILEPHIPPRVVLSKRKCFKKMNTLPSLIIFLCWVILEWIINLYVRTMVWNLACFYLNRNEWNLCSIYFTVVFICHKTQFLG